MGLRATALCAFLLLSLSSLFAVHPTPSDDSQAITLEKERNTYAVPPESIDKMEKKAKRAIIFTAIGVGLVVVTIAALSIGMLGSSIPLAILGLAALFGNIGFVKAMRIRTITKSQKRSYAKARKRAKIALMLACVLGITLIFGLFHMLVDPSVAK